MRTTRGFVIALAAAGMVAAGLVGCAKAPGPGTTPSAAPPVETAWQTDDVTALAGAPAAAFVLPASYVSEGQAVQHLVYLGLADNHLHELWSDPTGWHTDDLTAATGAPEPIPESLVGYTFEAQRTQHVVYVGASDQHVHDLWSDATGWHTDDLTAATGAPPVGEYYAQPPLAFAFEAQLTQHVFYVSSPDHHIHELRWDSTGWHTDDLTADTGAAPPNGFNLAGYAFEAQGTLHLFYTASDGAFRTVRELWWDPAGWHTDDLGVFGGTVAAYVSESHGTQHVIYDADGHLHHLWWDSSGGRTEDLTAATGARPGDGSVVAYAFEPQGTQHLFYDSSSVSSDDQHVHELWSDTNGWHTDDLTAATGAPSVFGGTPNGAGLTGYAFAAQGTQHLFYVSYLDNHIHELWWGPRSSAPQPRSSTPPTAPPTMPPAAAAANAAFVGQWRVHGASLDITPTTATYAPRAYPCSDGSEHDCREIVTLTVVSGDDTQLTLQVSAASYTDDTGAAVPTPDLPAVGATMRLEWQAPGLLKTTYLYGLSVYDGNPYWCGVGISRINSRLCGA